MLPQGAGAETFWNYSTNRNLNYGVSGGENLPLWYTLADEGTTRAYELSNGHHTEVLPAPLNQ